MLKFHFTQKESTPIFTDTKVEAGQTKTVEFSVRPTPIYYEKSEPKGTIADGMVNVVRSG